MANDEDLVWDIHRDLNQIREKMDRSIGDLEKKYPKEGIPTEFQNLIKDLKAAERKVWRALWARECQAARE